jgi:ubiquinone/menaquinone biosynthesis C-methylase UbiE
MGMHIDDVAGPTVTFPDVGRRNALQEHLEVPALVRLLGLPAGGRLLEVGCGRGVALPPLHRLCRPRRLSGIDVEGPLLEVAGARVAEAGVPAELRRADVGVMPFEDGAFDLVVDFGTCYWVPDRERALREIVRVLAPGGLFACETLASQLLAHPLRSRRRPLPWRAVPELRPWRHALLWTARRKN